MAELTHLLKKQQSVFTQLQDSLIKVVKESRNDKDRGKNLREIFEKFRLEEREAR
jgi:hypothetical protein